jgi:hypothetical protein
MNNFWNHHGIFFLIFITLFPRLTLLFSSVAFGGLFWWLGFFFAPRILVAVLATMSYMNSNPILVLISWIVALSGESTEKYTLRRNVRFYRSAPRSASPLDTGDVIDVEYKTIK